MANVRMPKALKALKGIARLTALADKDGNSLSDFTEKQYNKMLSDIEQHVEAIREAFAKAIANPEQVVKVKTVAGKYFS